MREFARGFRSAIASSDATIEMMTIVVQKEDQVQEIRAVLDDLLTPT
jgi:hypothetical protein